MSLYNQVVKLAYENKELREELLPILSECGECADHDHQDHHDDHDHQDHHEDEDREPMARFEKGKPADPTENMSPEDAEEWRDNTEKYKDKFKKDSFLLVQDLVKLSSQNPELKDHVKRIIASLSKEASQSYFRDIVDYREIAKFLSELKKVDPQSSALLKKVVLHFHAVFTLDSNTQTALNKLTNLTGRGQLSPDITANQIFKIADLLGIR